MKFIKTTLLFLMISLVNCSAIFAQKNADKIKKMIESQDFVFKAQMANPVRGGVWQLTPGYDLTVKQGSIVAYLPYYGQAQVVPIGSSEGGIKFSSTDFDYKNVLNKKRWRINIKPNDVSGIQQLYLTIYDDGNATLDVMSIQRDNISFSGYIK